MIKNWLSNKFVKKRKIAKKLYYRQNHLQILLNIRYNINIYKVLEKGREYEKRFKVFN